MKNKNKLVERKAFVDAVGIKCPDMKKRIFVLDLTAFRVTLVKGKATDRQVLARTIREIEVWGLG